MKTSFYGRLGRFAQWLLRTFSPRYRCDIELPEQPVVYVCRHLNMHGPYTTLKWFPFDVHPMILHVYFDRNKTVEHMTGYTLSTRFGRKPRKFSLLAHIMGRICPALMASVQGVPVYRNGTQSVATLKCGLKYLLKGESLIVYPDIVYTGNYDRISEIYDGFLFLGDLYYKKTGMPLAFVPLLIDDKKRQIIEGKPICVSNFRRDRQTAASSLKAAINMISVVPHEAS